MSRKNRGHRQKKKSVLSQVIYYLVIVALVVGIIGIIVVNRQQRAKRAEYKPITDISALRILTNYLPTLLTKSVLNLQTRFGAKDFKLLLLHI